MMMRSLLSLKAMAAPCQDVLWGLGGIQQCPEGDFKDLSPFPPKLLLTQDPGHVAILMQMFLSVLPICRFIYIWLFCCPIQPSSVLRCVLVDSYLQRL